MPNAEAEVPPQQGDKKKKPEPFHLAEKIGEMVDYGYPLTMSFPRKDRELADLRSRAERDDPTELRQQRDQA